MFDKLIDRHLSERATRKRWTVCLCGSTRFSAAFTEASLLETLAGRIVLTIGAATKSDAEHFGGMHPGDLARLKDELDLLHFAKIDRADEVLILNVDGYIGDSTRRELYYARLCKKSIRFLERPEGDRVSYNLEYRNPTNGAPVYYYRDGYDTPLPFPDRKDGAVNISQTATPHEQVTDVQSGAIVDELAAVDFHKLADIVAASPLLNDSRVQVRSTERGRNWFQDIRPAHPITDVEMREWRSGDPVLPPSEWVYSYSTRDNNGRVDMFQRRPETEPAAPYVSETDPPVALRTFAQWFAVRYGSSVADGLRVGIDLANGDISAELLAEIDPEAADSLRRDVQAAIRRDMEITAAGLRSPSRDWADFAERKIGARQYTQEFQDKCIHANERRELIAAMGGVVWGLHCPDCGRDRERPASVEQMRSEGVAKLTELIERGDVVYPKPGEFVETTDGGRVSIPSKEYTANTLYSGRSAYSSAAMCLHSQLDSAGHCKSCGEYAYQGDNPDELEAL